MKKQTKSLSKPGRSKQWVLDALGSLGKLWLVGQLCKDGIEGSKSMFERKLLVSKDRFKKPKRLTKGIAEVLLLNSKGNYARLIKRKRAFGAKKQEYTSSKKVIRALPFFMLV
ncbi:hypothetical protein ACH5RR_008915 [Cinchona calisaya]|uniref:Uncharacterized protein n=1 Tax=Cinchona calisaya TaxID=153742 RepID=A0ABD3AHY2_9GENT